MAAPHFTQPTGEAGELRSNGQEVEPMSCIDRRRRNKHDVNQPASKLKGKTSTRDCLQTGTDSLVAEASLGIPAMRHDGTSLHPLSCIVSHTRRRILHATFEQVDMKLVRFPFGTIVSKLRRLALSSPNGAKLRLHNFSLRGQKRSLTSVVYFLSL